MRIKFRHRFERDIVRLNALRSGRLDLEALEGAIDFLEAGEPLPAAYSDHTLSENWSGYREFHLDGDDLVIYRIKGNVVEFCRAGTHADLFRKR